MSAPGGLIAPSAAGLDAVIDISHLVAVSDFALVRRRGNILGVVHKASEGGDWFDPMYSVRRPQAEAVGLLWGAYHFGTRQYSGAEQAGAFLAAARPGPATLMALDLEPNERHPANTMTLDQAEEFVRTVYAATGRLPLVYTHPSWANGERYGRAGRRLGRPITPESVVSRCELWVADYRDAPELPWAWAGRGWRLWQYVGDDQGSGIGPFGASCQAVEGVDHCDRNLFAGGAAALRQFWMGRGGVV
jgi:lysozyme